MKGNFEEPMGTNRGPGEMGLGNGKTKSRLVSSCRDVEQDYYARTEK